MLTTGDQAPQFDATDQEGKPVRLSDFQGQSLLLWFNPRVVSPG